MITIEDAEKILKHAEALMLLEKDNNNKYKNVTTITVELIGRTFSYYSSYSRQYGKREGNITREQALEIILSNLKLRYAS